MNLKFDSEIDFSGMSTRLGLFYVKIFENQVHYTFIFTFMSVVFAQFM